MKLENGMYIGKIVYADFGIMDVDGGVGFFGDAIGLKLGIRVDELCKIYDTYYTGDMYMMFPDAKLRCGLLRPDGAEEECPYADKDTCDGFLGTSTEFRTAKVLKAIRKLLEEAKVRDISELVGVPVAVDIYNGTSLVQFNVLEDLI